MMAQLVAQAYLPRNHSGLSVTVPTRNETTWANQASGGRPYVLVEPKHISRVVFIFQSDQCSVF
jgi:hypothetical protein